MDDGIPLNDPFGGWVYWIGFLAFRSIDEVMRAAFASYGSSALGGVGSIRLNTSHKQSGFAVSTVINGPWMARCFSAAETRLGREPCAESFNTHGYIPVALESVGPSTSSQLATSVMTIKVDKWLGKHQPFLAAAPSLASREKTAPRCKPTALTSDSFLWW